MIRALSCGRLCWTAAALCALLCLALSVSGAAGQNGQNGHEGHEGHDGQVGQDSQVIPDQDGVERFALANGLEVVVVPTGEYAGVAQHAETEGGAGVGAASGVQLWLVVRAGSMDETDAQRGGAEVLRRVLMAGTVGLSGAQIERIVGKRDLGYGHRSGSMVGFDQTLYMAGGGPGADAGAGAALGFFAQLLDARRWVIDDERVGAAKGELLDEIQTRATPEMRARQRWLPELMRGTLFGARPPVADADRVRALTVQEVRDFGRDHYQPGRALLLVVGDVDVASVKDQVTAAMGAIPAGERGTGAMLDGRLGVDVAGRAVLGSDPGYEGAQAALVWFGDRGDASVRPWSVRAGAYTGSDLREMVIGRVAGEIVRHRMSRLGAAVLGSDADLTVEQIDLWGQADLLQVGVELDAGSGRSWEEAAAFLVRQCDRLCRDGAVDEELAQARRSVLSRWHREADDWRTHDDATRAGMVHWLVTTGRPVLDMVRFDARATALMSTITDQEIGSRMRAMIDPRRAAAVAVERGDPGTPRAGERVRAVVAEALGSALDPIAADWMQKLAGPLLDVHPQGGKVLEISQHPASGVMGASLSSGVRVWARAMDDGTGRVCLTATVWGDGLASGEVDERRLRAALVAWDHPASESRGTRAMAVFMKEHGIEVETRVEIGGAQLRVSAPGTELEPALELLYVLLDEPMIDPQAYARWAGDPERWRPETLDRALDQLYQPARVVKERGDEITLDQAQRVLTRLVRNGKIDVGIAGVLDPQQAIERSARLLGALVTRNAMAAPDHGPGAALGTGLRERAVTLGGERAGERGFVLGYVGAPIDDLPTMRAAIVGAKVLSDRLGARAKDEGLAGTLGARLVQSDAVPGRWVLMIRAQCPPGEDERAGAVIDEVISAIESDGIGPGELAGIKASLGDSIGTYFGTGAYWSARMSSLGLGGRSLDDLWTIREGYAAVSPGQASGALRDVLVSRDRFRVVITGEGEEAEK